MNKKRIKSLLIVLVLLVLVFASWQYNNFRNNKILLKASDVYSQMMVAHKDKKVDAVQTYAENLINNYSTTPYGVIASMLLAKSSIEHNNLEDAVNYLNIAIKNSKDNLVHIAKIRLARVLLVQEKYDAALQIAISNNSKFFNTLYLSLQGDIYTAMGDLDKAQEAYNNALQNSEGSEPLLELKISNL